MEASLLRELNTKFDQLIGTIKSMEESTFQTKLLNDKLDVLSSAIAAQTDIQDKLFQLHTRQAGHHETTARELHDAHTTLASILSQVGSGSSKDEHIVRSLDAVVQKTQDQFDIQKQTHEWFQEHLAWNGFYTQCSQEKLANIQYRQSQVDAMPSDANRMVDLEARGEKWGNPAAVYQAFANEMRQGKIGMGQLVQKPSQRAWLPAPLDSPFSVSFGKRGRPNEKP